MFIADLAKIPFLHQLSGHLYADDIQIYADCNYGGAHELAARMSSCVSDVARWLDENNLLLNPAKTEAVWFSAPRSSHLLSPQPISCVNDVIYPSDVVRNLGARLDSHLTMRQHISSILSSGFTFLRGLRSVRRILPGSALQTLISSCVLSRVDYCNTILCGLPDCQLKRLQSLINSAARLISRTDRFNHISPVLRRLHWLRIRERIDFKVALLVFKGLHGLLPSYLSTDLHRVSDIPSRGRLRSSSSTDLVTPRTRHVTMGDRAFPAAAASAWNRLPPEIRNARTIGEFRVGLKTHLFSRSFPESNT